MSDTYSNFNILVAMTRLEPELPALFGDAWLGARAQLETDLELLRTSQTDAEQKTSVASLLDAMSRNPKCRQRLDLELCVQSFLKAYLISKMAELHEQFYIDDITLHTSLETMLFGFRWSIDTDEISKIPTNDLEITQYFDIKQGGLGGGKSIKFQNLDLDFDSASEIVAGALLQGFAVIEKPHPFVIAAGMLLLVNSLLKAMTTQISERDASVFWGFIQARNKDNVAPESAILARTNKERHKYGLKPLDSDDFYNALVNLESIHCIKSIQNNRKSWRIIENYHVKGKRISD